MIKNIDHEKALELKGQVTYLEGQVVSKTLAQNPSVSMTLFAFDKGEEISTHESKGDAFVLVLDGNGTFIIDGKTHDLKEGETIIMPAGKPHSVHANSGRFKMLLTVIFPRNDAIMPR